jgi:hypothetical protein
MYMYREDIMKQAQILADWVRTTFNMTTEFDEDLIKIAGSNMKSGQSPCSLCYSEVKDIYQDQVNLALFCQHHSCTDYCLRTVSQKSSKNARKRKCRMGCGEETFLNSCATPGWKICENDLIQKDDRGFKKIVLKRNHTRILQTSLFCLQAWRANCDVSIMIYDSDPSCPDLNEIAEVTDYVVSYACKGNAAYKIEKKQIQDFTTR